MDALVLLLQSILLLLLLYDTLNIRCSRAQNGHRNGSHPLFSALSQLQLSIISDKRRTSC